MKRLLALAILTFFVACSGGPQVRFLAADELPAELYGDTERPEVEARKVRAVLYFVRTDTEGRLAEPARLEEVRREVESRLPEVEVITRMLLEDPTTFSGNDANVRTAIPPDTQLLGVSVSDGLADVNLSAQFESAAPGVFQVLRVAQVVWTLTALPEVDAVRFRIHGAPQPVIDQLGVAHERVGAGRYSQYAPAGAGEVVVDEEPLGAD